MCVTLHAPGNQQRVFQVKTGLDLNTGLLFSWCLLLMKCMFCKLGPKHIEFPPAKKAGSSHKNVLLPEIFLFAVTYDAVAGC